MPAERPKLVPRSTIAERWSTIPHAARYQVSDLGRVSVIATGRVLWQLADADGFWTVRITTDTGTRSVLVHLLVAAAFVPNPHRHPVVRHLDGEPSRNGAADLAWGTRADRENDALRAAWFHRIAAAAELGPGALDLLEAWERPSLIVLDRERYRPSLSDPWPLDGPG